MSGLQALPTPSGRGVLVFYEDNIYELDCSESCHWIEKQQKLKVARNHAVIMYIPEKLANCN